MVAPTFSYEELMKITAIEEQKKHKNRMSIFLDGAFAFGIDAFSLYALKLKEGDEIDDTRLAEIKRTVLFEDAKRKAMKLLSSRSYTVRDMTKKLSDYTGDAQTTEKTIVFLKEYRFLDDADYARRYASDCFRIKKLGKRNIRFKLLEKGISPILADEVLAELEDTETTEENITYLLRKKLKGDVSFQNVMKAKRYLATKGYSFDEIDAAVSKLKAECEDDFLC